MRIVCLLSLLFVACVTAAQAEMEMITTSFVANDSYAVVLVDEKDAECCPGIKEFNFQIRDKKTGETSNLTYGGSSDRLKSLKSISIFEDKALVVEGAIKRASSLGIFDLKTGLEKNSFWCYNPTPSPSKRFWVFKKFYPYHGPWQMRTDVVLIYDVGKVPAENKLELKLNAQEEKLAAEFQRPASPIAVRQVGLPIYPEQYAKEKVYVLSDQHSWPQNWRYGVSSPFLWSEDEQKLVFLCMHHDQTYIVKVDLSAGIDRSVSVEKPIQITEEFVQPRYMEGFRLNVERGRKSARNLSVQGIAWDGPDHVMVKTSPAYYRFKEYIRLQVP